MNVNINTPLIEYIESLATKFNVSNEEAVNSILCAHWILELSKNLDQPKQEDAPEPIKKASRKVIQKKISNKSSKELKEKARMKRENDILNYYSLHAPVVKKNPEEGC